MTRFRKLLSAPSSEIPRVVAYKGQKWLKMWDQRIRVKYLNSLGIIPEPGQKVRFSNDLRFFCFAAFPEQKTLFMETMEKAFPDAVRTSVEKAEAVCGHIFDHLGSGPTFLGHEINWNEDFKSHHSWPTAYFEDLPVVNLTDASDIKVPWELSRFHHAVTLGKAYFWTGDDKYCQEFLDQLDSWTRQNRAYYSVNWRNAMEVAIRAVNWIWAYFYMRESALLTPDRQRQLATSLFQHGRYIFDNLEFGKKLVSGKHRRLNGNHYMSNVIGLVYIGMVLKGEEPKRWLEFAKAELLQEVNAQFLPDGSHCELSPSYHRLVIEMCLSAFMLLSQNGVQFPAETRNSLMKAVAFIKGYIRPDGLAPLIRDADDGRLYVFDDSDFRDHRHLLALGAILFNRADLLSGPTDYTEETMWLQGTEGYSKYQELKSGARFRRVSDGFEDSGYYFLRSSRLEVAVICADIGMFGAYGGHAHSDCLSFELSCGRTTPISECGSFVYSASPEWRNRFRSTECHNTVRIDSLEINRFDPTRLFSMESDARPLVKTWLAGNELDILVAEHYGYSRLSEPVTHRRTFVLDKDLDTLLIEDCFEGNGEHLFEAFFHMAPEVCPSLDDGHVRLVTKGEEGPELLFVVIKGGNFAVSLEPSWISERYGLKRSTKKIRVSGRIKVPLSLCYGLAEGNDKTARKRLNLTLGKLHEAWPHVNGKDSVVFTGQKADRINATTPRFERESRDGVSLKG